ncbi:MAG: fumarylacetoacetate hydrolase family protein [Betaproteobacteria bacterium]|nr:fumarylacetoacetate hydrolase family protein [Betaproteobacteria bacterium]
MAVKAQQAGEALLEDHLHKRNLVPFARNWGAENLEDAYAIQAELVRRLVPLHGPRVGYKIGLTSPRMQQMCSIEHPVGGVVLASRRQTSGIVRRLSDIVHLGLEFEICVRIGRDLPPRSAPYTMDDIAQAVSAVAPAFEVIDDRNSPYPLDVLSLVADNAWNEGIVLGEFRESWPDLAKVRGTVERNGEAIDQGEGSAVLGHPFAPVVWLANHLSARGETLRAGEIVSTGSLVTTRFPEPGDRFRFTVEGIGSTELILE